MLTCYKTTMLADGKDQTRIRIALMDSLSREITDRNDSIRIYVTGDGLIKNPDGSTPDFKTDTAGLDYSVCLLQEGVGSMIFQAGTNPDNVKVEAHASGCWPGGHEIHTIPGDVELKTPGSDQLPPTTKPIDRMIGADISWIPEFEARGRKFYENGMEMDAVKLMAEHGFNYIRLRIFVNPENENGYSPGEGYCGLNHTLDMAQRVRDAGMKLLLDFHYSDYWADPQKQFKPQAWKDLGFSILQDSVKAYTSRVLQSFKQKDLFPDMVQVGNEINHGLLWPTGHIGNLDSLALLLKAGVAGVEAVDNTIPIMMHIALGGQHEEAVFWLDNMIARGVSFDVLGLSYYPRWHGTLEDLQFNLTELAERYNKPLNVVEYSDYKEPVHHIVFSLPDHLGAGTCIWEPLGWGSRVTDREGNVSDRINVYDQLSRQYLQKQQ
jgi:beta-galactosidase